MRFLPSRIAYFGLLIFALLFPAVAQAQTTVLRNRTWGTWLVGTVQLPSGLRH